jgi:predicted CXXCH cytochrome family protein
LCDGCHSVNYNIQAKTVTEWNVGCEKCHGPDSEHVARPSRQTIVNPARMDFVHANDVCIQCHSQGRLSQNMADGKYYDWPVGFQVGLDLKAFWRLEDHKAGETTFTHFADGTGHKNRMQGNDFVLSAMYTRGVTCFSCHDVHGTDNGADLIRPANVLCLQCHGTRSPTVRAPRPPSSTHHKAGGSGSDCVACHMPKIQQTIADVNVRSHTFRFIFPATSGVPNACNTCHSDKSAGWAADAMRTWPEVSPWRIGN